jgi:dihydrofolate reductase/thymidylate synthase
MYACLFFSVSQPWKISEDMKHFKHVTMGHHGDDDNDDQSRMNAVIMGRKTWDSIPPKFRPLEGRINVVLTRNDSHSFPEGVIAASSLPDACQKLNDITTPVAGKVFVIGGAQIYEQALAEGYVKSVLYTEIAGMENAKFDAFFPELPLNDWDVKPYGNSGDDASSQDDKENGDGSGFQTDAKSGIRFRFLEFTRKQTNHEEMQYLDLCREILNSGVQRGDRTGTGTLSKFGTQMRFSLRDDTLPLLTTKRTFWRGVAEELLWFISVSTQTD